MTDTAQTLRAMLWMIGAIASFTAMAVAGRAVSFELDTFEIMMYRSLIGVVIVMVVASATGHLKDITRRHLGVQFIRNIAHFTGQNLWFFALTVIPLAQVFALEFTSPIWVLVLSPFVLGERMTPTRATAAALGFAGILIVARPFGSETVGIGVITAALAAVCFAITIMTTKRLTRSEKITCILFYLTTLQAVFGIALAGYDGDIALPSATTAPWLLLIGCAGLIAHFCLTTALSLAPATVVVPIDFARLPVIALIGAAFYAEALDVWVLVGALLIFAGNYFNIWSETRKLAHV
ncbi:DMT family transporter [Lentibacter sp. XHP0401]|uniref:DMT family transporter n=1 Tax=Lentibacter sp. XHP0401 TaxID=2984334 RepID=UPI0021E872F3|nr:DMT family transporter [Lentibacter sp. XHP0401]MCV2892315.1 DMT family transporter [Lentibacter sp. XHP0401]